MKIKSIGRVIQKRRKELGLSGRPLYTEMYLTNTAYYFKEKDVYLFTAAELIFLCKKLNLDMRDFVENPEDSRLEIDWGAQNEKLLINRNRKVSTKRRLKNDQKRSH